MRKHKNILCVQYYKSNNTERQKEIDFCLQTNIACEQIDHIHVFCDLNLEFVKKFDSKKVSVFQLKDRLTYSRFLTHLTLRMNFHNSLDENAHFILANSDIAFDETLSILDIDLTRTFVALSRYDNGILYNRKDSQDVWILQGDVSKDIIDKSDFPLGVPGCDNRIAHVFQEAGYKVINPSMDVKTHHHHKSNHRTYDASGGSKDRIPPPYHRVEPTKL